MCLIDLLSDILLDLSARFPHFDDHPLLRPYILAAVASMVSNGQLHSEKKSQHALKSYFELNQPHVTQ